MSRKKFLKRVEEVVCKDRNGRYGEPEDNFEIIAELWGKYLNARIENCKKDGFRNLILEPWDVSTMMSLLKIGRMATAQHPNDDDFLDLAGYAVCGGAMVAHHYGDESEWTQVNGDGELLDGTYITNGADATSTLESIREKLNKLSEVIKGDENA